MQLNIFNTPSELSENLATLIVNEANKAIKEKDRFDFVLTGGSSPKELYRLLATRHRDEIDWSKVFFFFGDERTVLPFEPDYNGLMAKESFFEPLDLRDEQIFYVNTNLSPEKAALDYKERIDQHFNGKPLVFDFILLGMGDDAHTASIFPETDLVENTTVTVASVWVEKLNTNRVSFTAPLINQAKNVVFITFGANKAAALQHVLSDDKNVKLYPSQLIKPEAGTLQWYIDNAASSLII